MSFRSSFAVVFLLLSSVAWGADKRFTRPHQLIVGVNDAKSVDGLRHTLGLDVLRIGRSGRFFVIRTESDSLTPLTDLLEQHPQVRYVERNALRYFRAAQPNDPGFEMQWALRNTGQAFRESLPSWDPPAAPEPGADLNLTEYWDSDGDGVADRTGSGTVKVAILDDGFMLDHQDLQGMFVQGIDVADGDSDPSMPQGAFVSHGTPVAHAIGGVSNDGVGLSAPNWSVQMIPVKIGHDEGGLADSAAIADGVDFAIQAGARIINLSFGGPDFSQTELEAYQRARDAGILLVTAASNDGFDDDRAGLNFPPMYDLDNLLTVAASNRADQLAWFSNYGSSAADVAAPGAEVILAAAPDTDSQEYEDGTSFASPYVAGVAALLWDALPTADYREIKARLIESATDGGDFHLGLMTRSGRVDANAAINLSPRPSLTISEYRIDDANGRLDENEQSAIRITVENGWMPVAGLTAQLFSISETGSETALSNPIPVPDLASGTRADIRFEFESGSLDTGHQQVLFGVRFEAAALPEPVERSFYIDATKYQVGETFSTAFPTQRMQYQQHWTIDVGTLPSGMNGIELELQSPRILVITANVGFQPAYGGPRSATEDGDSFPILFRDHESMDADLTSAELDDDDRVQTVSGKAGIVRVPVADNDIVHLAIIDLNPAEAADREFTLTSRYVSSNGGDSSSGDGSSTPPPAAQPRSASGGGAFGAALIMMLLPFRARRLQHAAFIGMLAALGGCSIKMVDPDAPPPRPSQVPADYSYWQRSAPTLSEAFKKDAGWQIGPYRVQVLENKGTEESAGLSDGSASFSISHSEGVVRYRLSQGDRSLGEVHCTRTAASMTWGREVGILSIENQMPELALDCRLDNGDTYQVVTMVMEDRPGPIPDLYGYAGRLVTGGSELVIRSRTDQPEGYPAAFAMKGYSTIQQGEQTLAVVAFEEQAVWVAPGLGASEQDRLMLSAALLLIEGEV